VGNRTNITHQPISTSLSELVKK